MKRVDDLERIMKTDSKHSQQAQHHLSINDHGACLKFILPIADDRQNIGVFLKVSGSDLKQIESDYSSRCRDCAREMIRKWLIQVNPPPTWKSLAEAIKIIDPSIAETIVREHC